MNNSDDYKTKYLKYKRDYLNLKKELEGGWGKKITSQAILYIILDIEAYNIMTYIIKRTILSIEFIDTILTGSALKIIEDKTHIKFLENHKVNRAIKHARRKTNAIVGISLPEYEFKGLTKTGSIGNLIEPYKQGNIFNNAGFIKKISDLIKEKLTKRDIHIKSNNNNIHKHISIQKFDEVNLPFYGIFLFETDIANCIFIDAYKLTKVEDNGQDISNNITVASIEMDPPLNVHFVRDDEIFNSQSSYMTIVDSNID
jgi:hypothetical protein